LRANPKYLEFLDKLRENPKYTNLTDEQLRDFVDMEYGLSELCHAYSVVPMAIPMPAKAGSDKLAKFTPEQAQAARKAVAVYMATNSIEELPYEYKNSIERFGVSVPPAQLYRLARNMVNISRLEP